MEIPPKVCNKRSVIPLSSGNNFISSEEFTYFAGGVRRKESLVDTREYVHSYTLYHGEKTEQVALNVNE